MPYNVMVLQEKCKPADEMGGQGELCPRDEHYRPAVFRLRCKLAGKSRGMTMKLSQADTVFPPATLRPSTNFAIGKTSRGQASSYVIHVPVSLSAEALVKGIQSGGWEVPTKSSGMTSKLHPADGTLLAVCVPSALQTGKEGTPAGKAGLNQI